ncbi:MAG TPA: hypothetical protein VHZ76_02255, partial [Gammaproteobacteria bacterium]|nr:hypothetical protein [Gammaproteobacteria bacterium]
GLDSYAISFPITALVMIGILQHRKSSHLLLFQLLGWALIILIGMSIPGDKKLRYILPLTPAIALLAAYPLVATTNEKYYLILRQILLRLFYFAPLLFGLLTAGLFYYTQIQQLDFAIAYLPIMLVLFALQFIIIVCCWRRKNIEMATGAILFIATSSFVWSYIAIVEPIELYFERARDFVTTVEQQRVHAGAPLIFYKEPPDRLVIKYLIHMQQSELPIFVDDEIGLQAFVGPGFFVTRTTTFQALPPELKTKFQIVTTGKLGHREVVVFRSIKKG